MRHIRITILACVVAASSLLVASPAQASCTEWLEGRCLEKDVCTAAGLVSDKFGNCIE